jgi:ribonucleoside-diphosphate reductase alpha chain
MQIQRFWTTPGVDPFDAVIWERRDATITGSDGSIVFEQRDVEVPAQWSQLATNIVASKYFRGTPGAPGREHSVRQLIGRVVATITRWAEQDALFETEGDLHAFRDELTHILLNQIAAFNSPVWFNVGVEEHPQCSACFINSIEDKLASIMDLTKTEGLLFKYGSGTGTNFSPLRGRHERLSGGGLASGPVSFMRGFDAFAGVIKSRGKTRRAAKMVILDMDHPDILDFISCKADEEKKAWALIDAGYDGSVDGPAYASVCFQNANHSVRVTDAFMEAVEADGIWRTVNRVDGETGSAHEAGTLLQKMAEAAHLCGDPGVQFDSQINEWNTCKASGRINASNPCSEYMFINDSACNLASINLMRVLKKDGDLGAEALEHTVEIMITAQDVVVGHASYPTERIRANSLQYRPLGLGYANLGAVLMARGLPYDSDEGRAFAATITALMTGAAYVHSAKLAEAKGTFDGFPANRDSMLEVMRAHRAAMKEISEKNDHEDMLEFSARHAWNEAVELGLQHGYRNAQVTAIAPTGTIGFMMDCDTTGIEPDIALVKYKKLVGGGVLKIVNGTVPEALECLGYTGKERDEIVLYLHEQGTVEGAPHLQRAHLSVFDCALKPAKGKRCIDPMGHVRMMAAVQPFVSGAISKTVNLPAETTPDEIADIYLDAWRLGLKSIAVYRDGCKRSQPLNTKASPERKKTEERAVVKEVGPIRRRLPDERKALTHKFSIAGHEGYITVGLFEDGEPGEVFITMSKQGSTISGLMDSLATSISLALQYGVPLAELCRKFSHTRYEPSGYTGNREIPLAKSITDYIFRWMALRFLKEEGSVVQPADLSSAPADSVKVERKLGPAEDSAYRHQSDDPICVECGSIMVRSGSCHRCSNCGSTSGCS